MSFDGGVEKSCVLFLWRRPSLCDSVEGRKCKLFRHRREQASGVLLLVRRPQVAFELIYGVLAEERREGSGRQDGEAIPGRVKLLEQPG